MNYGRSEIHRPNNNHVYYNVSINNTGNTHIPAKFIENRSQPILKNPSDYDLSVIRFKVSGHDIPIFVFDPAGPPNLDPNVGIYSVTLEFDGAPVQIPVRYTPNNDIAVPTNFFPITPSNFDYYSVFSYQNFIDMINRALSDAYAALFVVDPTAPPFVQNAAAPYLIYNETSGIITLVAHKSFSQVYNGNNPTIKIFFNYHLYDFFGNFPVIAHGEDQPFGQDFELIVNKVGYPFISLNQPEAALPPEWSAIAPYIQNEQVSYLGLAYYAVMANVASQPDTNPADWQLLPDDDYIEVPQEYAALYNWNSMQNVIITTGAIPIKAEFIPVFTPPFGTPSSTNPSLKVLTDFEPFVNTGPDTRQNIQYVPTSEYRLVSIQASEPFNTFDMQVYWSDGKFNLFPVTIPPNGVFTCKIMFRKKNFSV